MGDDEIERGSTFQERELRQRETHHREQMRLNTWSAAVSIFALLVSAGAVVVTLLVTTSENREAGTRFRRQFEQSTQQFQRQTRQSIRQFESRSRDDHYNQIVEGLASDAAAVQTNSMRLLTQFVKDANNYSSKASQRQGVEDAIQVLAAFMEDNSTDPTAPGLSNFQSPMPIVLSRAMDQLNVLLSDDSLGQFKVDISRSNLHGVSLPGFRPNYGVLAVSADFRRAILNDLDLRSHPSELRSAFFTCSSLKEAQFGEANLANADLTGADLSGADLSSVKNLAPEQLRGATLDRSTVLPERIASRVTPGWGNESPRCVRHVNDMTGMRGGQGYARAIPCPTDLREARAAEFEPQFAPQHLEDLVEVCQARDEEKVPSSRPIP